MTEREIAEFYEKRRGDTSLWSEKPTRARIRRGGSLVFSLRLAREEMELLQAKASECGVSLSEFIRRAALKEAQAGGSSASIVRIIEPATDAPSFGYVVFEPNAVTSAVKKSGGFLKEAPEEVYAKVS